MNLLLLNFTCKDYVSVNITVIITMMMIMMIVIIIINLFDKCDGTQRRKNQ